MCLHFLRAGGEESMAVGLISRGEIEIRRIEEAGEGASSLVFSLHFLDGLYLWVHISPAVHEVH